MTVEAVKEPRRLVGQEYLQSFTDEVVWKAKLTTPSK